MSDQPNIDAGNMTSQQMIDNFVHGMPETVKAEPLFLVIGGGDQISTEIVPLSRLDDAYLLMQWGDLDSIDPDEQREALDHFHDPDEWQYMDPLRGGEGRVATIFTLNLEGDWVSVYRLPDNAALAAHPDLLGHSAAQPASTPDASEWSVTDAGSLQSADFKHDVKLSISGDFATREDRLAYAHTLVARLNATPTQPVEKAPSEQEIAAAEVASWPQAIQDAAKVTGVLSSDPRQRSAAPNAAQPLVPSPTVTVAIGGRRSVEKDADALDAARYRWLRSRNTSSIGIRREMMDVSEWMFGDKADRAIDAALAARTSEGDKP